MSSLSSFFNGQFGLPAWFAWAWIVITPLAAMFGAFSVGRMMGDKEQPHPVYNDLPMLTGIACGAFWPLLLVISPIYLILTLAERAGRQS